MKRKDFLKWGSAGLLLPGLNVDSYGRDESPIKSSGAFNLTDHCDQIRFFGGFQGIWKNEKPQFYMGASDPAKMNAHSAFKNKMLDFFYHFY